MLDTKTTLKINDASFDNAISSGVALVDFWATWCGPCRIQGPIMEKVAQQLGEKAKICKLDVDANPVAAEKNGVVNIPTLLLFKDGNVVERFVGLQNEETLLAAVNKYL